MRNGSGKHYLTMWEMQTGGNDKPKLADPFEKGIPTLDDEIHVTAPGLWFSTVQTLHIDGNPADAPVYEKQPDGSIVLGTTIHVHATAEWISVSISPI